jgi:hypothetical protein
MGFISPPPPIPFVVPSEWSIDFDSGGDNFNALLFRMIRKADKGNLERLRVGFPYNE